jgi:hypothetical protein
VIDLKAIIHETNPFVFHRAIIKNRVRVGIQNYGVYQEEAYRNHP